jgi:hypothetical protein
MTVSTCNFRMPIQKAALAIGGAFLLIGLFGFAPGVTAHHDHMTLAGHQSAATLLGLFSVSALHNLVHLVFAIGGIALARSFHGARAYLIGGGLAYLVLFLYGLVIDRDTSMNFLPVNQADNWLHLSLALAMIAFGVAFGRIRRDGDVPTASLA